MENEEALRQELANLIRENADEISLCLERRYVEEYPYSRANQMDAHAIHQWTLDALDGMECAVRDDDPAALTYEGVFGDSVEDPHEPELTLFASFVSAMLFESRTIAPLLARYCMHESARANDLINMFESCMQDVIAHNCAIYARAIKVPGSLRRSWNLLSGMSLQDEPLDTPAKRYLGDAEAHKWANDASRHAADVRSDARAASFSGRDALSKREREVFDLLVEGKTNGEIASVLGIRQNTVKNHVAHIFDKFNVNTRAELIAYVLRG